MILSIIRLSVGGLALILLIGLIILPVEAVAAEPGEIVLREDGLLQRSASSLIASLGATVCVAAVFMIVWKCWEL